MRGLEWDLGREEDITLSQLADVPNSWYASRVAPSHIPSLVRQSLKEFISMKTGGNTFNSARPASPLAAVAARRPATVLSRLSTVSLPISQLTPIGDTQLPMPPSPLEKAMIVGLRV